MNPETDNFRGFTILMASVFPGGSISNDLWEPRFAVDDAEAVDRVATALRWIDVEYEVIRSTEQSRATEIRPNSQATLVGRILYCLGAPTGPKTDDRLKLPSYLADVDREHRDAFARTYVGNRGHLRGEKGIVTLREQRDAAYLDQLVHLLTEVTDARVTRNGKNVVLSKAATRALP